jgi:hypothetical protein
MQSIIQTVEKRCSQQVQKGDDLLKVLETFGWKDKRPKRTKARREEKFSFPDMEFHETVEVPATAIIPTGFIRDYHEWYSGSIALVEGNMPSRASELLMLHEGLKGTKYTPTPMVRMFASDCMTFLTQLAMASRIRHMQSVVASIPAYMAARLYDIELAVAQAYVLDELSEAEVLLKSRFTRAAGGIAGVLLERHLKLICDRHHPTIKYTKSAGISKLNDLLRNAGVYDVAQWRRVQWMGDVRNNCDHARTADPRREDVKDLIKEVRKFVSLFVV